MPAADPPPTDDRSPAVEDDTAQLRGLGRFGRFVARRHLWFSLAWVVVLVAGGWVATEDAGNLSDDFSVPGTDSQAAYDLLQDRFTSQNAATAEVVFSTDGSFDDAAEAAAVADAVTALEKLPGVASVSNPVADDPVELIDRVAGGLPEQERDAATILARSIPPSLSENGRVAVATVTYDDPITELIARNPTRQIAAGEYDNPYSELERAFEGSLRDTEVRAAVGGAVADIWNQPVTFWSAHADEVGLGIGAVLLLVAFGSLFGMVVPVVTALFGAVTASSLVMVLAGFVDISSAAPPVTLMISLGVGLDYSLLIVTRYRQFLAEGHGPHDAAGLALGTAGHSALFAGATVCIALLGLLLVPIPLVRMLGLCAAIGVAVMVTAALTLLPALLGIAGSRIDRISLHRAKDPAGEEGGFWGRFAARMAARPWLALLGGSAALLVLAVPFLSIQFGMPSDASAPRDLSQQQAYVLTDRAFGPGTNGPLLVAVGLPRPEPFATAVEQLAPVSEALGALRPAGTVPGVRYSVGPLPNSKDHTSAVIYEVIPDTGPESATTADLVRRLRGDLARATEGTGLEAHVGGATATLIDLSSLVQRYLPVVIGAVVLGAFLLLLVVFRSVLVPLKAALLNLLSIGAAYGVVVAVFQWGWGKALVGLDTTIPIVSFVPLIMFVILFGLSMDYEVFLMSRIREEWEHSGDPSQSVIRGVATTARVITTAALIMMAVYLSFVTNPTPTVKLIGFGMAVAVLLDATVVRMVLVPAAMELLGRRAWWFPSWLSWLPHLDVDGSAKPGPGAAADEPDRTASAA